MKESLKNEGGLLRFRESGQLADYVTADTVFLPMQAVAGSLKNAKKSVPHTQTAMGQGEDST